MSARKTLPYNGNKVKSPKLQAYACERCGSAIGEPRIYAALSRGKAPAYCSDVCRNQAKTARARERKISRQ